LDPTLSEDVSSAAAAFYFDLASPLAYLAAERVLQVLPGPAAWRPVLARELAGAETPAGLAGVPRAEIEHRARELGLQPIRWPEPFPFDSSMAMRVATYAASIGRAVPFAQAAFRQAFAGGHSLEDPDFVLIAAAACEMHPTAVLRGAELRSVGEQLARASAAAARTGVTEVPAVVVGEEVFAGERGLERAAARMRGGQLDGRAGAGVGSQTR
jgi:2-hydroxychromene-2-carboxylate isomerase